MSSILPGMDGDFAKGVSGTGAVYDTSPAGLGLSPAYLASASASASSSNTTSGTIFPTAPANGDVFVYTADATNGVKWAFQYDSSQVTYKWVFIGGPPLFSYVATSETTVSTTYAALSTVGPSVILPLAGDFVVGIGVTITSDSAAADIMSYAIGGTAASDNDFIEGGTSGSATSIAGERLKTGLTAVTLTAKYKTGGSGTGTFSRRWMRVLPVRVSG